jgi:hypothetical protein
MGVEYKRAKSDAKCQKILADLVRTWSPQKIGKVLEKLGFDKYKKGVKRGGSVRRKYIVPLGEFVKIAKAYDYEPQSASAKEGGKSNEQ